jgi:hypothetical protein
MKHLVERLVEIGPAVETGFVDHITDAKAGILQQVCRLFEPEQMQLEEKLTAISLRESVRQILALNSIRSLKGC